MPPDLMTTSSIKTQVGPIRNAVWFGGTSNPPEVFEQIACLLFPRRPDDLHMPEGNKSARMRTAMERPIHAPCANCSPVVRMYSSRVSNRRGPKCSNSFQSMRTTAKRPYGPSRSRWICPPWVSPLATPPSGGTAPVGSAGRSTSNAGTCVANCSERCSTSCTASLTDARSPSGPADPSLRKELAPPRCAGEMVGNGAPGS